MYILQCTVYHPLSQDHSCTEYSVQFTIHYHRIIPVQYTVYSLPSTNTGSFLCSIIQCTVYHPLSQDHSCTFYSVQFTNHYHRIIPVQNTVYSLPSTTTGSFLYSIKCTVYHPLPQDYSCTVYSVQFTIHYHRIIPVNFLQCTVYHLLPHDHSCTVYLHIYLSTYLSIGLSIYTCLFLLVEP